MENLFQSADEVLLEYAEKAESNAMQTKFLEGQRELWAKKTEVVISFRETFARELLRFMSPTERPGAPGSETLSLVSKDKFERSLALQTISDQAVQKNRELYYALSMRLGVIIGSSAVAYEELPAGPHQLAGVFERTAQILKVERQVLLTLYTLFEREVIRGSPPWHEELNEELRNSGILPNLKYQVKRKPDKLGDAKPKPDDIGDPAAQRSSYGHTNQNYQGTRGCEASLPRYEYTGNNAGRNPIGSASAPQENGWSDWADSDQGNQANPEGENQLGDQLLGRIRELLTARRARQSNAFGRPARPDPANPAPPSAVAAVIDSPQVRHAVFTPKTGTLEAGVRKVVVSRELLEKVRNALEVQRKRIKDTVGDEKLSHFDEDTIDIVGMLFEVMLNDNRLSNTVKALLSHLHTPYLKLAVRDRAFLKRRDHPGRHLFDNMIEAGSRWVDERDLTQGIYPKLQRVVDLIMKAGDHPLQLLQELDEGLSAEIALRSERQKAREIRTVEAEKGKARLQEAREVAVQATQQFLTVGETPVHFLEFVTGPWVDYLTLLYLRSKGDTHSGLWNSALALCARLRTYVDGLARGITPKPDDLAALRDDLSTRLSDAIPHYEAKVEQLFELFSSDYEVTIVASDTATPPRPSPVKVELSTGGKELLQRLPKLPPGSWVAFHNQDGADQVVKLSWFNRKTERFLFVDQEGAKALVVPLQKLADQIDRESAHVLHATGTSYVESSLERAINTLNARN